MTSMHAYTQAHVQAGSLGHVLYIEAVAADFAACGFGCFIDNGMADALGLVEARGGAEAWAANDGACGDPILRSMRAFPLYHVAVGRPDGDRGAIPLDGDASDSGSDDGGDVSEARRRGTASAVGGEAGRAGLWSLLSASRRAAGLASSSSARSAWARAPAARRVARLLQALPTACRRPSRAGAVHHHESCTAASRFGAAPGMNSEQARAHFSLDEDDGHGVATSVGKGDPGVALPPRVDAAALVASFGETWDPESKTLAPRQVTVEEAEAAETGGRRLTTLGRRARDDLMRSLLVHGYAVLSLGPGAGDSGGGGGGTDTLASARRVVAAARRAGADARRLAGEVFNEQSQEAKDACHGTAPNVGYIR